MNDTHSVDWVETQPEILEAIAQGDEDAEEALRSLPSRDMYSSDRDALVDIPFTPSGPHQIYSRADMYGVYHQPDRTRDYAD
jgi:hypothetical protein